MAMWEPDFRYWKSLCGTAGLLLSMDFAMPSSPPDPSNLSKAGLFFPAVKVKHLPAQSIEEKIT